MNRYFSLFVTLSIFYLFNQPDFVFTSSGGNYGSSGASKLNLGVWIPPMTLRLPKFNMPKIKISATIKPRKNQPPMKIHLPEMSLNAKALGDDDNYGGSGGYSSGGGGSSYSSGGGDSGYSGGGGGSYSSGGDSYSSGNSYGGGNTYNDYGGSSSGGYRASASNQPNNYQASNSPQSSNEYQQPNYNQMNNDYSNRYQQQDQRNAYYVDNQQPQQQQISRYQPETVSYGSSNNIQSNIQSSTQSSAQSNYNRQPIERNYRSVSGVMPLSNYAKREKGASAYGYGVNAGYSARYGTRV